MEMKKRKKHPGKGIRNFILPEKKCVTAEKPSVRSGWLKSRGGDPLLSRLQGDCSGGRLRERDQRKRTRIEEVDRK
jgi:hypothetical protein